MSVALTVQVFAGPHIFAEAAKAHHISLEYHLLVAMHTPQIKGQKCTVNNQDCPIFLVIDSWNREGYLTHVGLTWNLCVGIWNQNYEKLVFLRR
jgi:hypothetical protein